MPIKPTTTNWENPGTAVNHYNDLSGEFRKIDNDIIKPPRQKRLDIAEEVSKPNVREGD